MKEYIRDNGKIRNCTNNVAKMTWYEYGGHFGLKATKKSIIETFCAIPRIVKEVLVILLFFVMLIFLPVILPFVFMNKVRKARKEVDIWAKKE
jgi:hypothetical protein